MYLDEAVVDEKLRSKGVRNVSYNTIMYLLGQVYDPRYRADNKVFNEYKNLSSTILQSKTRDYKAIFDTMSEMGIIERGNYVVGERATGYRFVEPDYKEGVVKVMIKDKKLIKKFTKQGTFTATIADKYAYLNKWFEEGRLVITDYELLLKEAMDIAVIKEINSNKHQDRYELYQSYKLNIDSFIAGDYNLTIDTTSYRFHSPYSRTKRELRKYYKTNKAEALTALDIKSSQPYLLIALFNTAFYALDNKKGLDGLLPSAYQSLDREIEYDEMRKVLDKERKIGIKKRRYNKQRGAIIMLVKVVEQLDSEEVIRYKKCIKADIYNVFKDKFNEKFSVNYTRDGIKKMFLTFLYDVERDIADSRFGQIFLDLFPTIYKIISTIKSVDYKLFSVILQRVESYLMIDNIAKQIALKDPTIPMYTIHDSIATTAEHVDTVHEIMMTVLKDYIGMEPIIDVKLA
jgi:hypothetical protein